MIKLALDKTFKSLEPFTLDLPEFVILTGINGAGKTQLLQAIQTNQLIVKGENGSELNPKKYVTSQTLSPNGSTYVSKQELDEGIYMLWDQVQNYQNEKSSRPNYQLREAFGDNTSQLKLIHKIAESAEKAIEELIMDDIYQYYPINDFLSHTDVFYQNFASLFKRYQNKFEDNEYRQYRNEKKGHSSITFLTNEEFIEAFGEAPWDLVNKIIAEANLGYHISSPVDNHRDSSFELKLINNFNKAKINFGDLSSGEKVLMSLVLALYNSNFDIDFPKVLLMDEPDASLHPSMSKKFLEVIQNVFVEEKGVNVIMTTHSPSTVAIAPEDSIYVVNKTGVRIEKSSKDKALKILTSGVPSFSVNYENRRQIFVESPNDVIFFEKLYRILSDSLHSEISLSFISSGESRTDKNGIKISNCDQVQNITNTLRDSGNTSVWGIIDWDLKNNRVSDFVKILGDKKRYSIESYVFDPLLLGALLLRQKIIQKSDVGLLQNETFIDLRNFEKVRLQKIVDFVISKVSQKIKPVTKGSRECLLLNGINITIPTWYLHHYGHELEDKIIEAFPKLNEIKRNKEEALKVEIIDKIIDDLPEIISVDILRVFQSVQE